MEALVFGSLDAVRLALAGEPDLSARDAVGRTPWLLCLEVGDVEKARLLYNQHGIVLDDLEESVPLLFHATMHGHPAMVEWLIGIGADLHKRDRHFNKTALMHAAQHGSTRCMRVLIDAGLDVHATDQYGMTALNYASTTDCVRLLVAAGADVDHIDETGYSRLKSAAEQGDEAMVAALLTLGADPDADRLNEAPLFKAVSADNLTIVELLLAAGANPNAQTVPDGWFPLMDVRSEEMLTTMLAAGADVHLSDAAGADVLQYIRDPELIDILLQSGAQLDPKYSVGGTALHRAVQNQDEHLAAFLIERGAHVGNPTSWGQTPLMQAAEVSFVPGVQLLLQAGADPNGVDEDQRTALFYAAAPEGFTAYQLMQENRVAYRGMPEDRIPTYGYVESDSTEVLQLLKAAGAAVDARDKQGITPLMMAASCGRPARVARLLELGANPELRDAQGLSAADHAQEHPRDDQRRMIMQLLTTL